MEDDITTTDHATFYSGGKLVLTIDRDTSTEVMWDAIEAYMVSVAWYPSVWFVSDHGNAHLMER